MSIGVSAWSSAQPTQQQVMECCDNPRAAAAAEAWLRTSDLFDATKSDPDNRWTKARRAEVVEGNAVVAASKLRRQFPSGVWQRRSICADNRLGILRLKQVPLLLDFPVIGRQAHRRLIPPSRQINFLQFLRKLRQLQPKHRVACINGDFFMSSREEPPKFCNIRNAASMELSVLHSPRNA